MSEIERPNFTSSVCELLDFSSLRSTLVQYILSRLIVCVYCYYN